MPDELVMRNEISRAINLLNKKKGGFSQEELKDVLMAERIDYEAGLKRMDGDTELYRQRAVTFASVCEERLRMLHEYNRNEDVMGYTALVHEVRSDAKSLGASELMKTAWEQEIMGKDGDYDFLKNKFTLLATEYQRVAQCYNILFCGLTEEGGK